MLASNTSTTQFLEMESRLYKSLQVAAGEPQQEAGAMLESTALLSGRSLQRATGKSSIRTGDSSLTAAQAGSHTLNIFQLGDDDDGNDKLMYLWPGGV